MDEISLLLFVVGVSLGEDEVDLSRELTGHGISNLLAGALGSADAYSMWP